MANELASAICLDTLRYSHVWEDHRMVERGLDVRAGSTVLSIASAGCNVLNLLLKGASRIIAVDMSPAQTALVHLKIAAARSLTHSKFVELLGFRDGACRPPLYEAVRGGLPRASQDYWDDRLELIDRGIARSGRLERHFADFQDTAIANLAPDAITGLLSLESAPACRHHFRTEIATPEFERAFRWHFGWKMLESHGRHPAQFRYVGDWDVGGYLWGRFKDACERIGARGNPYLEFFLTSRYRDLNHAPPYLRPERFGLLKFLVARVSVVTATLEECLADLPERSLDAANLSDVFEYVSQDATDSILSRLAELLRPGGRACYWNLFVPRSPTPGLHVRLRSHRELARRLWLHDRAWFYSDFHVEEAIGR